MENRTTNIVHEEVINKFDLLGRESELLNRYSLKQNVDPLSLSVYTEFNEHIRSLYIKLYILPS